MPKSYHNEQRKIAEAALRLAAARGWDHVTLKQIAKAAKISSAQIEKKFVDTRSILPVIVETITAETLAACEKPGASDSMRDRLFDMMMARFDQLQKRRKAILSIASAARKDFRMASVLFQAQKQAMFDMAQFCGLETATACSYLIFLWGIYAAGFRAWSKDETIDMSKTMVALDRYLRLAERAATLLHL